MLLPEMVERAKDSVEPYWDRRSERSWLDWIMPGWVLRVVLGKEYVGAVPGFAR